MMILQGLIELMTRFVFNINDLIHRSIDEKGKNIAHKLWAVKNILQKLES
jgi:hypothetical protein